MRLFDQLSFSGVSFSKSILWGGAEYFLFAYLIIIVGIGPQQAGTIIFASLVYSAMADPVLSFLVGRRTVSHKLSPLLLAGGALSGLTFWLLFSLGTLTKDSPSMFLVIAIIFAFRTAYTLLDLPHNAMLATLTNTPSERSYLIAQRNIFGSAGRIVIATVLAGAIINDGGSAGRVAAYAALLSVISLASFCACFPAIRRRENVTHDLTDFRIVRPRPYRELWRRREFRFILLTSFLAHATIPVFTQAFPLLLTEIGAVERPGALLALFTLAQAASAIPLAAASSRFGKMDVLRLSVALLVLTSLVAFVWLGIKSSGLSVSMIAVFMGVGMGGTFNMIWSLVPDALTGKESHPAISVAGFASFTFVNKAALGLSAFFAGQIIGKSDAMLINSNAASTAAFILPALGAALVLSLWLVPRRSGASPSLKG